MANQAGYGSRKGTAGIPRDHIKAKPKIESAGSGGIVTVAKYLDWVTVGGLIVAGSILLYQEEQAWGAIALGGAVVWAVGAWKQPGLRMLTHLRSRFIRRR